VPTEGSGPERTCIVTRRQGAAEAMIRFVRAPDGRIVPDIRSRLPGRGVWITARAPLVAEAVRKQAFARSLKARADAPPSLAEDVDALLEKDCLQMLSLANKAGAVVAGFGKVAEALEKSEAALLIEARDGSADGRRKLAQCAKRRAASADSTPKTVTIFTSSQLDLALGRTNVIHAAVLGGRFAAAVFSRCARLALYRCDKALETIEDAGVCGAPAEEVEDYAAAGREDQRLITE
jgi:uncharacterized protein